MRRESDFIWNCMLVTTLTWSTGCQSDARVNSTPLPRHIHSNIAYTQVDGQNSSPAPGSSTAIDPAIEAPQDAQVEPLKERPAEDMADTGAQPDPMIPVGQPVEPGGSAEVNTADLRTWIASLGGSSQYNSILKGEQVNLSGARFSDADLERLATIAGIAEIDLSNTMVSDSAIRHLLAHASLKVLKLDDSLLTDAGASQLAKISSLEFLGLSGNGIGDEALAALSQLPRLQFILLDNTQVTDSGLAYLEKVPLLSGLSLMETQVTVAGVRGIQRARPECVVIWNQDNPRAALPVPPAQSEPLGNSPLPLFPAPNEQPLAEPVQPGNVKPSVPQEAAEPRDEPRTSQSWPQIRPRQEQGLSTATGAAAENFEHVRRTWATARAQELEQRLRTQNRARFGVRQTGQQAPLGDQPVIAFSPESNRCALYFPHANSVVITETSGQGEWIVLEGELQKCTKLTFDATGEHLLGISAADPQAPMGTAILWDVTTGQRLSTLPLSPPRNPLAKEQQVDTEENYPPAPGLNIRLLHKFPDENAY